MSIFASRIYLDETRPWFILGAFEAKGGAKRHRVTAMSETDEKRIAPRHRVLKQGRLAFDGGGAVDCMVRNMSNTGARVEVVNPVGLPGAFTLVIPSDKFTRRCHAVWSHDKRIGVAFD
jgi:hypothetical protein